VAAAEPSPKQKRKGERMRKRKVKRMMKRE
jgi:hypothetical protein